MSPSVARMTGPGTVPLYVQAGKKIPGAISTSLSMPVSVYSRTRPGLYGQRAGRVEELVEVVRAADRGRPGPIIAACPIDSALRPDEVRRVVAGVDVRRLAARAGLRRSLEGELAHERRGRDRRGRGKEPTTGEIWI